MKKLSLVLVMLLTAVMAFSVSGRINMRFGSYLDTVSNWTAIGPMFSYWGVENNVDLWQSKDGTGFEVNFDSIGLMYKTREAITLPGSLDALGYSASEKWGIPATERTKATSPGYFQIRNIRIGSAYMATGLALWTLIANKDKTATNSGGTVTDNYKGSITFVKAYADYKLDFPINENITLKMYDWELMWLEFFMGGSKTSGFYNTSLTAFTNGGAIGFKCYIPPHLILNLGQFEMDFSPKVLIDNSMSNMMTTNGAILEAKTNNEMYWRLGATVRLTYNFDRVFGVYCNLGYYNEYDSLIEKINGTNSYYYTYTANILPMYAGLKINVTPNISFNIGYGMNLMINNTWRYITNSVTNIVETGPQLRSGYLNNWINNGLINAKVAPERTTYGDGLMDLAFLKFGATIKIMRDWEMGMQAAVSLNDAWTREYLNVSSLNYTWTYADGSGGSQKVYNWLSFLNWMNYDNNMYIKFENDVFVVKMTFDMWARNELQDATIMNLFSYIDFGYKF